MPGRAETRTLVTFLAGRDRRLPSLHRLVEDLRHLTPQHDQGTGMYLDDVIPDPDYRICHSRVVRAPATVVWDELTRVPMSALPVAYALEAVRLLPARLAGRRHPRLAGRTFLDVTPIPILFSEPPNVVLSAGIGQAWRLLGGPTPPLLDAAALRAWTEPGWIKVGMGFRLESSRAGTVMNTETRVVATDPRTRRAFAAYWFVIRGSSSTIRREVLRVVAHRAETPPRRT